MADGRTIDTLTGLQRDLLFLIAVLDYTPGVAIRDELEPYYDADIGDGHLYRNLNKLIEKGLVEKDMIDETGETDHHSKKMYTLTRRGEREFTGFQEWKIQQLDTSIDENTN
jgi:PadR family transcriptional regulator PadR